MTEQTDPCTGEPDWEECMRMLAAFPGMGHSTRVETIERLLRHPSPGVRPRALRMGAALLPEDRLVAFIRSDGDDVLRNAGLEMLKLRGASAFNLAVTLLRDDDRDVVLQAVLVLDHIRDPRGLEHLRPLLHHADTNVVQSAIVALGHLGDARTIPDLLPFLEGDLWLQIAAIQALGDLRLPQAVPPLKALLPDLVLGTLATEAMARIGGREVFVSLAQHWVELQDTIDPEPFLGLLAHVIQGLPGDAPRDAAVLSSIKKRLDDSSPSVRLSAATCLLASGPFRSRPRESPAPHWMSDSESDRHALAVLGDVDDPPADLPPCLTRRKDLCETLLGMVSPQREWGFILLAGNSGSASPEAITRALEDSEPPACLEALATVFQNVHDPSVAAAMLDVYLRLPIASRGVLTPALQAHKAVLFDLLEKRTDIRSEDHLVLSSRIGAAESQLVTRICGMGVESRAEMIPQVASRKSLVIMLPWRNWIAEDPDRFVPLLAEVAGDHRLFELAELLRPWLSAQSPCIELVRAMGALGDREAVGPLAGLLENATPLVRAQALESLGLIGGPEARDALARAARTLEGRELRLVFRALARCGAEEDGSIFKEAASHPDWVIRMSCAEFLARFPNIDNLPVLAALAADPVPAVAQKVQAGMDV